jgi:hypothetical protein
MLANSAIEAARRLLLEGKLSRREIADRLGISRGSVNSIFNGTLTTRDESPAVADGDPLETGPIERCATCGGRVYMPCRLCAVRDWKIEAAGAKPRSPQRGTDAKAWSTSPDMPLSASQHLNAGRFDRGARKR